MRNLIKLKHNCINEIVNIIKKYNISVDEIIIAYITKYENQFNEKEKFLYKTQFNTFNKYNQVFQEYITESNQKLLQHQIIDDYIVL